MKIPVHLVLWISVTVITNICCASPAFCGLLQLQKMVRGSSVLFQQPESGKDLEELSSQFRRRISISPTLRSPSDSKGSTHSSVLSGGEKQSGRLTNARRWVMGLAARYPRIIHWSREAAHIMTIAAFSVSFGLSAVVVYYSVEKYQNDHFAQTGYDHPPAEVEKRLKDDMQTFSIHSATLDSSQRANLLRGGSSVIDSVGNPNEFGGGWVTPAGFGMKANIVSSDCRNQTCRLMLKTGEGVIPVGRLYTHPERPGEGWALMPSLSGIVAVSAMLPEPYIVHARVLLDEEGYKYMDLSYLDKRNKKIIKARWYHADLVEPAQASGST